MTKRNTGNWGRKKLSSNFKNARKNNHFYDPHQAYRLLSRKMQGQTLSNRQMQGLKMQGQTLSN